MAHAITRHALKKDLKLYLLTIWATGPPLIVNLIDEVIRTDFPEKVYGEALEILRELSERDPVIYHAGLAVLLNNLGNLYRKTDRGAYIAVEINAGSDLHQYRPVSFKTEDASLRDI